MKKMMIKLLETMDVPQKNKQVTHNGLIAGGLMLKNLASLVF